MIHLNTENIGFIDSGIGGLTFMKTFMDEKIRVNYYYIADRANIPYGDKPQSFLLEKMNEMSKKLIEKNIKKIIIACNTATTQTIDTLREKFPKVIFLGVEPFINYFNHPSSLDKKTALILTPATFQSTRFQNLKKKCDPSGKIDIFTLPKLAIIIERLTSSNLKSVKEEIDQELSPLQNRGYQQLILGCTHYPIISRYLSTNLGVAIIDPAKHIYRHAVEELNLNKGSVASYQYICSFNNSDSWTERNLLDHDFMSL